MASFPITTLYYGDTPPKGVAEGTPWVNSTTGELQVFINGQFRTQRLVTARGPTTLTQGFKAEGRQQETVSEAKTLDAGDSGVVQVVTADAGVVTLPATAVGLVFIIENGGPDGTVLVEVAPAAADKLIGNGFTAADNKSALNTKATAKKGDRIVLVGDGVDGYYFAEVVGTWAREG